MDKQRYLETLTLISLCLYIITHITCNKYLKMSSEGVIHGMVLGAWQLPTCLTSNVHHILRSEIVAVGYQHDMPTCTSNGKAATHESDWCLRRSCTMTFCSCTCLKRDLGGVSGKGSFLCSIDQEFYSFFKLTSRRLGRHVAM